jgi:hypothetical protein
MLPHAQVSLGSKQASLDEKDAARATLEAVVRDHPKSAAAAAAQTQLGDMLWAEGKVDEARKVFSDLPRNYPGSPFVAQVDQRLKIMDAGLPSKEVDAPPAPPKPVETPDPAAAPLPGIPRPPSAAPSINVPPPLLAPPAIPSAPPASDVPTPPPAPSPKAEEKAPAPEAPAPAPKPDDAKTPDAPAPAPAPSAPEVPPAPEAPAPKP